VRASTGFGARSPSIKPQATSSRDVGHRPPATGRRTPGALGRTSAVVRPAPPPGPALVRLLRHPGRPSVWHGNAVPHPLPAPEIPIRALPWPCSIAP
jgi:hypothetical protein